MDLNEGAMSLINDLWSPYKELVNVVEGYLTREGDRAPYAVHTFESVLRCHKQTFLSLLKNPPKNPTNRDEIRRGISEGVNLPNVGRTLLSKELVDEAIIISDMFNVNEYVAVQLLYTAQRQCPRRPGLARGLLAVLLYYDGRRAVLHALKQLLMARDGVSWCISAREEVITYVTRYVEQLISDGLLQSALDALIRTDLNTEIELLQNNRALPPAAHHVRLLCSMETTRNLLAGVIFAASAQRGLSRDFLMRLMSEIAKCPQLGCTTETGALDEIPLALHMALLYALDLSVLHRREDGEELSKKLPLIQDQELISVLVDELSAPAPETQESQDKNSRGVRALCQLSLGLALAALKRAPQSLLRSSGNELRSELLDQDEVLVDVAIDGKVFEYLDEAILSSELVAQEEYYQRRIHTLITDFIVLMHSKLMEMRARADEAARSVQMYVGSGLVPPAAVTTRGPLDALLRCVEKLYKHDPLTLREDYWLAVHQNHSHTYRSGGRAASLYKFVRLSGSLVWPGVVAGYLRALASLTVARHTWALLSRSHSAHAHVSADHLLTSLLRYYCNLRQDPSPLQDQFHASSLGATAVVTPGARAGRLLVRQEEVEAMIAALKLIAAVAREDPAACTAICENLQWDAINCMFGLICCHVPLQLKAELCLTLAALGSTPTTAGRVWSAMEAAQLVLPTNEKKALNAELHEVECRIEEYPLSRAFLVLLDSLCAVAPVPRTLGAGTRTPGLDPYVQHALNRLALPAPHRSYIKPTERCTMLSLCLRLFVRWLEKYSPEAADFPPTGGPPEINPPPGFHILLQLHTNSDLLRLLFHTLDETVNLLDRRPLPAKVQIEDCLLNVLRLLERGLMLEKALQREATEANKSVLIIGLSKLILAPEGPQHSERLTTICRVLQRPGPLAARASSLLALLLQHTAAAKHLVAVATAAPGTHVRHYFVECLEAEEWPEEHADDIRQSKESVIGILQHNLPAAAPNLAHYLLGYTMSEQVSRSALNEPGVAGFPRTCLHSVLDILDEFIGGPENVEREANNLVEGCYRLLYWVCARNATSAPALRFLRSRDHYLCRHLRAIVNLESARAVTLSARSWVLRACACEAGAAAAGSHHAALATLLDTLTRTDQHPAQEWEWCLLRRTIDGLPVTVEPAVQPRWEQFHAARLQAAIEACDISTGVGGKRISVPRVYALLSRDLDSLQASTPQRAKVDAEITKVLEYVTEVNRQRNLAATLTHYYDSWRQLTEIIFCVAPHDVLTLDTKKNLILNILQDLLNKIPPTEVLPQIGNLASGTVLLLLVNLRHCYVLQKRESNLKASDFETTFFGPSNHLMHTKSLTLKFILHKILSWILVSGGSTQKMRVNLYGALLNYLNIVNLKTTPAEYDDGHSTYVSRLDSSISRGNKDDSNLKSMVKDVIGGFGSSLCALVCGDCVGAGMEVCRMVALSCLDTLLEIHPHSDWMTILTNQGYLRSLIDSLLQHDEALKQVLEPRPKSLHVLYVYESKMALLIKMAGTRRGAETVLAQGALATLAGLRALSCHPDVHAATEPHPDTDFLPSAAQRFRQMLIPALALCNALISSLGAHNHSAVLHITHFLLSHIDCIDIVLRAAHPSSPQGLLEELEAITGVIARASNQEVFGAVQADTALHDSAAGLQRVQGLMLALIPRFAANGPAAHVDRDQPLLYYKIVCNLVTYARNIMEPSSTRALFRPALAADDASHDHAPHCGAIVDLLQVMVSRCHSESKLLATINHQLQNMHTMTLEDLKKLVPQEASAGSPTALRAAAAGRLVSRSQHVRRDLSACLHVVEVALYLVWRHLHLYLRRAVDTRQESGTVMSPAAASRGAWGGAVSELRRGLAAVFHDRFADQLLDTAKNQPEVQRGLLDVLLKDIKAMIQFSPL